MSKAALSAGKHVFCEKPLAHSVAEAREIRELARQSKLMTQVGTQGGSSATFRRSMEVIQAGVLGPIREVHCWINRTFPPSAAAATEADPVPRRIELGFSGAAPRRCCPSRAITCAAAWPWGGLAGLWLTAIWPTWAPMPSTCPGAPSSWALPSASSVNTAEPLKDSYPSATDFRWDFPARSAFAPVTVWWHDGPQRPARRRSWAKRSGRPTRRSPATACCSPVKRVCSAPTPGACAAWSR